MTADLLTQIKVYTVIAQFDLSNKTLNLINWFCGSQVNTVVMEVTHASPKIAAMEFFDVNIRLLPTVYQIHSFIQNKKYCMFRYRLSQLICLFAVDWEHADVCRHSP